MKNTITCYSRQSYQDGWFVSVTRDRITGIYHLNAQDSISGRTAHRIYFQQDQARRAAESYVLTMNTFISSLKRLGKMI
jgi:hypothetical protein